MSYFFVGPTGDNLYEPHVTITCTLSLPFRVTPFLDRGGDSGAEGAGVTHFCSKLLGSWD